ncbi:MAG: hypothetical protein ACJ8M1_13155 [Chthoniobacterales bacterium]
MGEDTSDDMGGDPQITLMCRNCGEEITDSRARLKKRDWECPYCGGSAIGDEDSNPSFEGRGSSGTNS